MTLVERGQTKCRLREGLNFKYLRRFFVSCFLFRFISCTVKAWHFCGVFSSRFQNLCRFERLLRSEFVFKLLVSMEYGHQWCIWCCVMFVICKWSQKFAHPNDHSLHPNPWIVRHGGASCGSPGTIKFREGHLSLCSFLQKRNEDRCLLSLSLFCFPVPKVSCLLLLVSGENPQVHQ